MKPNSMSAPSSSSRQTSGLLFMLASSVCFATGGLALKYIGWNALAINGARSLFGAMAIGSYLLATKHRLVFNKITAAGALSYALMTTMFVLANKMTSAGSAIVLQYTCPVWIVLLQAILFRKKPDISQSVTLCAVFAGVVCFFASSFGSSSLWGDLIALVSGIFYAILFLINSIPGGDAISSVFFGMLASAVVLGPLSLSYLPWSGPDLAVIAYLGFVQVGIAYICFSIATNRIAPLAASLINGIEPVLNPILVAIFWHELLTPLQMIGAFIVVASILAYSIFTITRSSSSA